MDRFRNRVVRSPRFLERRRDVMRARRRRVGRGLLAGLLVLGTAGGAIALARSPVFELSAIDVVGAVRVPKALVVEASGLTLGQNALRIDSDAIAAGVRRIPEVRNATVERAGPLGVRIRIEERRPAVRIETRGEEFLLDADGIVLEPRDVKGLPHVIMHGRGGFRPGVTLPPADLLAAVRQIRQLLPARARRTLGAFELRADGELSFEFGGTRVLVGETRRIRAKMAAMLLVRERVWRDGERLLVVDVRAPSRPVARIA